MPLAVLAVSAGVSAYSAYRQHKDQQAQLAQSQQAINKQSGLADTLADYSRDQYQLGKPALNTAIGMYQRLASGNRGEIQSEIAPDVNRASEAYSGTARYLEQQGVRGGVRDTQLAENARQQAGTVGTMPFLARQNAIKNLASIGSTTTQQGIQGLAGAGTIYGGAAAGQLGLGRETFDENAYRDAQMQDFGKNMSGLIWQYYLNNGRGGNAGRGGQSLLPNGDVGPVAWGS